MFFHDGTDGVPCGSSSLNECQFPQRVHRGRAQGLLEEKSESLRLARGPQAEVRFEQPGQ
jgi:hypothetical protein